MVGTDGGIFAFGDAGYSTAPWAPSTSTRPSWAWPASVPSADRVGRWAVRDRGSRHPSNVGAWSRSAPGSRDAPVTRVTRALDEGAAVGLRQDRPRRPGPGPRRTSAGSSSPAARPPPPWPRPGSRVTEVAEVTGAPEMLGGRVKTLHPKVHGGILADRSKPVAPGRPRRASGIEPIDLVVCNLYPFSSDPSIELIDVGGPTMVRAAAKNHAHVGVVVDPADYERRARRAARRRLAVGRHPPPAGPRRLRPHRRLRRRHRGVVRRRRSAAGERRRCLPPTLHLALERAEELRYGENPHQRGARYRDRRPTHVVGRRRPARRHGAVVPQPVRRRRGLAAGATSSADGRRRRRWPSSSTPTRAAPRSPPTLADAYRRARSSATPCRPSAASSPSAAPCTAEVARRRGRGPQADVDRRPVLRRRARSRPWRPGARPPGSSRRPPHEPPARSSCAASAAASSSRTPTDLAHDPVGLAGRRPRRPPTDDQWRDLELAWRVCARTIVQRHRRRRRRPGRGRRRRPADPGGGGRDRGAARPGTGPRAARRPATPSSRSATGSTCSPRPGWPPWSSPAARSATARSSPPPTSRHRHGAHRRAPLPALSERR